MVPDFFLAQAIDIIHGSGRNICECKHCKSSSTIPATFSDHPTDNEKAHFFKQLHHSRKCPANFYYLKEIQENGI